jgi:hypothetical protein
MKKFIIGIFYILAILLLFPLLYIFADWYLFIFTDTHFIAINDHNKFTIAWISAILSFGVWTVAAHI